MSRLPLASVLPILIVLAPADIVRGEANTGPTVYRQTLSAVAWIRGGKSGTAWVVDRQNRLLITSSHLVGKDQTVQVYFPQWKDGKLIAERSHYEQQKGLALSGKVIYHEAKRDLAAIQVAALPEGVTELKLAKETPNLGDRLHAVGHANSSTGLWGYASGLVRQVSPRTGSVGGVALDAWVIIHQLPYNEGDDGGPVVNDQGEVVGVVTSGVDKTRLVCFCVEVREIKEFLVKARPAAGRN